MEHPPHERRQFFRGKARPGRVMPVRFRSSSSSAPGSAPGEWVNAETRNIGVGGAFIASPLIQQVGVSLTIEITLPTTEQTFALTAIVRWSTLDDGGGMGVQFVGVDVSVLLELNDYFGSLTAT